MKIFVVVHPKSSQEKVECRDEVYHVYTRAVPEKGQANTVVVKLLAKHFKVPIGAIRLSFGARSKVKLFEIIS